MPSRKQEAMDQVIDTYVLLSPDGGSLLTEFAERWMLFSSDNSNNFTEDEIHDAVTVLIKERVLIKGEDKNWDMTHLSPQALREHDRRQDDF